MQDTAKMCDDNATKPKLSFVEIIPIFKVSSCVHLTPSKSPLDFLEVWALFLTDCLVLKRV